MAEHSKCLLTLAVEIWPYPLQTAAVPDVEAGMADQVSNQTKMLPVRFCQELPIFNWALQLAGWKVLASKERSAWGMLAVRQLSW
jgi:hypothetical protein